MRVYISGKISGIEAAAEHIFGAAEQELNNNGWIAVNPMKLNHNHDKEWHSYMKVDIKALCDCEAIYMLYNWTESKGAIIEHSLAIMLGITVYYQTKQTFLYENTRDSTQQH